MVDHAYATSQPDRLGIRIAREKTRQASRSRVAKTAHVGSSRLHVSIFHLRLPTFS